MMMMMIMMIMMMNAMAEQKEPPPFERHVLGKNASARDNVKELKKIAKKRTCGSRHEQAFVFFAQARCLPGLGNEFIFGFV
jgi:hypothetical protein